MHYYRYSLSEDILNKIVKSLLEEEEELRCPPDRILMVGIFVCIQFICTTELLYVMLGAVWQLPTLLSMLMLFKYLAKLAEISSAGLFVDMDRIHVETRTTALLHPLGTTEAG